MNNTLLMILILILVLFLEILSLMALREHYYHSKPKFFIILAAHIMLSIWLWFLLIKIAIYKGYYDTPVNISTRMNLTGMYCAVVFPRVLISFLHFSGKLIRIRKGGHIRWLTETGIIISLVIFTVIALGTLVGRFNFKTEEVTIKIEDLDPGLQGLKIVHLSDLHLAGFYRHMNRLQEAMDEVNSCKPDLILNTGDFISYGWREFDRCDTILVKAESRYGNFAVIGNHDKGTYLPVSSEADKETIFLKLNELITRSGYHVLNDEHVILNIKGADIAIMGVETSGRHPGIIHGDVERASEGTDSADFQILLIHDPNQWREDVTGQIDIALTLAGHTHGMQMGIITKRFRWSPSKYYYPEWNGLYSEGNQYLYVNRGLGVLSIPFRIWMPPEITLITLEKR
jgi:predicted MPP superfamily phosphohydrolase